jgi:hypothetical protein
MVLYDEEKLARLLEFERQRNPKAPLLTLYDAAIERLVRDNR